MTWIDLAAIDPLTSRIIACGVEVHRRLGPGLLESVYHVCVAFELRNAGLTVVENMRVPVSYKDLRFECALKADFLVNDAVIVEIKSVAEIAPVHEAQLLTYLRLTNRPVGLLMNFNVPILKEGIRRRVNPGTTPSVPPSL
jgi:GxxExxY protein